MFLTKLDPNTGLVMIDSLHDGVMGVKAFRDVINDPELGIECFTAIALTADYLTPWRFYNDADRPRKAMHEVSGNRDRWSWPLEKIQVALKKYDELQFDLTVEEGKIHQERKVNKLRQYREAEIKYGLLGKDGKPLYPNIKNPATIAKELREINADIAEYEKQTSGKDIYSSSPVVNNYKLSRLEQKILERNSIYTRKR